MNKKNTIVWILLIILMLFNFWLAELSPIESEWVIYVILFVTGIKFLSVAFQFMDLKDAHQIWKNIIIVFSLLFAGLVVLL